MSRIFYFLCFLLLHEIAFSQKNMQPGYIVTASGDSLSGKVNYLNWTINPREVLFAGPDGSEKVYAVAEINRLGIIGKDYYTKAIVTRSTRPIEIPILTKASVEILITDTVLLRNLATGSLNLYELKDFKDHYYLQTNDGPITELRYEVVIGENDRDLSEKNLFRGQLNAAVFKLTGEFPSKQQLERTSYKEKDLVRFIDKVNVKKGGSPAMVKQGRPKLVKFYGGVGVAYNNISIESVSKDDINILDMKPGITPGFQAGIEIMTSRSRQKFSLRFEMAYYGMASSGNASVPESATERPRNVTYELSMHNISPSFELYYKPVSTAKIDWYLGAGYLHNFSSYAKNTMVKERLDYGGTVVKDPYVNFETNWGQWIAKTGVMLNKKFDISVCYPLDGTFNRFFGYGAKVKNPRLQVNYRF